MYPALGRHWEGIGWTVSVNGARGDADLSVADCGIQEKVRSRQGRARQPEALHIIGESDFSALQTARDMRLWRNAQAWAGTRGDTQMNYVLGDRLARRQHVSN